MLQHNLSNLPDHDVFFEHAFNLLFRLLSYSAKLQEDGVRQHFTEFQKEQWSKAVS